MIGIGMMKDERTHKIIGAAMEVHSVMGPGRLEAVYQECLEIEFEERNIHFVSQPQLQIYYKNKKLRKFYVPDFIVFGDIIVEIKSEKSLTAFDESQIINSLMISRNRVGLLINFGEKSLRFKRFIA
ncbi:MAG TPA: GxxExxY protein [Planctomycetota bacterium]|nr:GxxExxY protein [Planctomycetota bacterium]